jgi:hypothetical protein
VELRKRDFHFRHNVAPRFGQFDIVCAELGNTYHKAEVRRMMKFILMFVVLQTGLLAQERSVEPTWFRAVL